MTRQVYVHSLDVDGCLFSTANHVPQGNYAKFITPDIVRNESRGLRAFIVKESHM